MCCIWGCRGGGRSQGYIATPVTSLKVITPVIAQLREQPEGYKRVGWAERNKMKTGKEWARHIESYISAWQEICPLLTNPTHVCTEFLAATRTPLWRESSRIICYIIRMVPTWSPWSHWALAGPWACTLSSSDTITLLHCSTYCGKSSVVETAPVV
jgi:hypothetical protein